MTTLLIGTAIGMVFMLIVIATVKVMKAASKEEDVAAPAPTMKAEERELMLAEFAGKDVPFIVSDEVLGQASHLTVDWVEAYGDRYADISVALSCTHLTTAEKEELKGIDAALKELRAINMNSKRHLEVKDMLDGKVYVYEPCKVKLDVDNLKARIALEITRDKDLSTHISSIYVSKLDVTSSKNRYEFDMSNPDDMESFKLLVREDEDYAVEMKELVLMEERISHYNSLVKKDRVGQENDGTIIIFPPTPEEIRASRAKDKKEQPAVVTTADDIKAAIEEFVSSSSL